MSLACGDAVIEEMGKTTENIIARVSISPRPQYKRKR